MRCELQRRQGYYIILVLIEIKRGRVFGFGIMIICKEIF